MGKNARLEFVHGIVPGNFAYCAYTCMCNRLFMYLLVHCKWYKTCRDTCRKPTNFDFEDGKKVVLFCARSARSALQEQRFFDGVQLVNGALEVGISRSPERSRESTCQTTKKDVQRTVFPAALSGCTR